MAKTGSEVNKEAWDATHKGSKARTPRPDPVVAPVYGPAKPAGLVDSNHDSLANQQVKEVGELLHKPKR